MKSKLLFSLLFLYLPFLVFSQDTFAIHVTNQQKKPLEYPEILIPNKLHRIGTKNGILILNKDIVGVGDSILVRYMGYESKNVIVDNELLASDSINISLDEKLFLLEPLVVRKNDFNAEAFFKKKKKNLLLPYFKEYHFNVDFEFVADGQPSKKGNAFCQFKDAYVNIDTVSITFSDTTEYKDMIIKGVKRASEINYLAADIFCHSKHRKRFYCDYKGVENNLDLWEFIIRSSNDMPWNLNKKDEFKCFVYLDSNGIITRIDVQLTNHLEHGVSYLLETEYVLFDRKLVASQTMIKLLPNANNNDTPELLINMMYSDFQKQ